MLEAGHLRETAEQLRGRARVAAEGALREQLLALAEYYDDMAADIEAPCADHRGTTPAR